jgi:hypothetical protein
MQLMTPHRIALAATAALFIFAGCGGDTQEPGVPNQCSADLASLLQAEAGSSAPTAATVPFEIQGADSRGDEFVIEGTFQGVTDLQTTVDFECFPGAEEMGLQCSTDKALEITGFSDGGPQPVFLIATALPVSEIQFPAIGTAVGVTVDRGEPSSMVMRRLQSQDDNLLLAQTFIRGRMQTGGTESFSDVVGPFNLTMEAGYTDASTATCLTSDPCPRLYRLEPLTFQADTSAQVETGARGSAEALGGDWSVWNIVSARRNDNLVSAEIIAPSAGGYCEDVTQPVVSVAAAPMKAEMSGE